MATTEFFAAIELGSSKVTGIAGKKNSDGSMQVLAYAKEDSSSFIRKGTIYNLDKTAQSLTSIINKLEGDLDNSVAKVYVGIGGQSLRSIRNVVSRDMDGEGVVSQELVDSICDENLETPLINIDSDQLDILDVAPQEYKVDNNLQINPVGALGSRIEGRFHNIVARAALKKNLEQCFEHAKIEIADILLSPLVTANAVLTESERRSGCALIDFGADTTTISIYKNDILRFLTVLPLGGNSITRDIASLQMEEEEAEKLKIEYGSALLEEDEEKESASCALEDGRTIELYKLNNIIEARAEEIIMNVWNQIQLSGYEEKLLAGLIITGGGAALRNIDDALRRKTRVEKIRNAKFVRNTIHSNLKDAIKKDGTQNTLFGLLLAGKENCSLLEAPEPEPQIQIQQPSFASNRQPEQVNFFEKDEALNAQAEAAREAKRQRDEEERKKKEEERKIRKAEKERLEKERREAKKNSPGILDRLGNLTKTFFDDNSDKM